MYFKMNAIKGKLNSRKGTSIFFGLLLFLAASILSAVMISAATTTIKRVESDRKGEQNYLTCSSAAAMLRDGITGTEIKNVQKEIVEYKKQGIFGDYTQTSSRKDTSWSNAAKTDADHTKTVTAVAGMLQKYIEAFYNNSVVATAPFTKTCTISVPYTDGEKKKMADVTAAFTFSNRADTGAGAGVADNGCNIIIKLSAGEGTDICRMVVSLLGKASSPNIETSENYSNYGLKKTTTTTTTTTYTWSVKDIIYGERERTEEDS